MSWHRAKLLEQWDEPVHRIPDWTTGLLRIGGRSKKPSDYLIADPFGFGRVHVAPELREACRKVVQVSPSIPVDQNSADFERHGFEDTVRCFGIESLGHSRESFGPCYAVGVFR